MKSLKNIIRTLMTVSLLVTVATGGAVPAVFLLAFGSMSLGIIIGEKTNGGRA